MAEAEVSQAEAAIEEAVAEFRRRMTGEVKVEGPNNAKARWLARDEQRRENARIAREAAQARVARKKAVGLAERVAQKRQRLDGVNVAGAIQLIQEASPADYDLFLLAEKYGQARSGVLKQFGAPRGSVETAYLAEAGLASPEHDPQGVEE